MVFRIIALLATAAPVWCAGAAMLDPDLKTFVCDERVERFRSRSGSPTPHHIDTLTAHVSFENGIEHYSSVHQNEREIAQFSSVSGAWSAGEFGSLLQQSADLLGSGKLGASAATEWNHEPVTLFRFDVPASESPWELVVENGDTRAIPFHADIWVSNSTGKIVKVERMAQQLPAELGILRIEWGLTLQPISIHGSNSLVPASAEYSVTYSTVDRRESNLISFTNYRRYGSESTIQYEH